MTAPTAHRRESDSLGTEEIPAEAYWGIHTFRALQNFPISGSPISRHTGLVDALVTIKQAAALANADLGLISSVKCDAVVAACERIRDGDLRPEFCVDVVQGGAGTSSNMNTNEVIANAALEHLGRPKGQYDHVHPINDVNRGQSTNDVYPTSVKLAIVSAFHMLIPELDLLATAFEDKSRDYADAIKIGRTQLQDAVPMTLGQELTAFGVTIREDILRIQELTPLLLECSLGATAVGTGITTGPGYQETVLRHLRALTGHDIKPAFDLFEATWDTGAFMQASGVLRRTAVKLSKISSDLRLLSSGPQAGLAEIKLPRRQAGSSIMPGKVNPVIPEVVNQIAFAIVGADVTVTFAAESGQLQLNAFEPIIAHSLLQSIEWLTNGVRVLRNLCVDGLEGDRELLADRAAASVGNVTTLVPHIGYEAAAQAARYALGNHVSLPQALALFSELDENEAQQLLSQLASDLAGPRSSPSGSGQPERASQQTP